MVALEEIETVAAGSALNVFTSNSPFTSELTDLNRMEREEEEEEEEE